MTYGPIEKQSFYKDCFVTVLTGAHKFKTTTVPKIAKKSIKMIVNDTFIYIKNLCGYMASDWTINFGMIE